MASNLSVNPRAVAERARDAMAKVRSGVTEARRSLPIRGDADRIRELWADGDNRAAVLDGIPARDVSLDFGFPAGDWGTIVTVTLRLESVVPRVAAQTLAGKVARRLKALTETGEVPTTAHNPAARADTGGEAT
jgi:hypothetical protein